MLRMNANPYVTPTSDDSFLTMEKGSIRTTTGGGSLSNRFVLLFLWALTTLAHSCLFVVELTAGPLLSSRWLDFSMFVSPVVAMLLAFLIPVRPMRKLALCVATLLLVLIQFVITFFVAIIMSGFDGIH